MPLTLQFADPLLQPPPQPMRSWRGCSAEHVVLTSPDPYGFALTGETHYLALHDIELSDGELHVDTVGSVRELDLRDTITFVPKGCAISGWARPKPRRNGFVALYLDPALLHAELDARFAARDPEPLVYARNTALQSTLGKLQTLIQTADADALHAESLCLLAALEVLAIPPQPRAGSLSPGQLRRVRDYIDGHLQAAISLSDLAGACGLSRFHFSRAFKLATGASPHQFVAALRVDAARQQLSGTSDSIEQVAARCGYSSAAQLRRAFASRQGTTPRQFRRETQS
ncbi:helix-turn-helix domain-containing protein [Phenylobacterium sp.]|uniref:helix-turn-helix domain-containing protein n=1 Tax=Phenylobacterium sp. TaxID=1871053 RepID=UPI00271FB5B2|nr:AraC family transcriptional regulator [Phenylobacterium sp.]MDO8799394.1 AraC family transcriptional regulator [Phenylobacterium sp.]